MSKRQKKTIEEYAEFEEFLIGKGIMDMESFMAEFGYKPSSKQQVLLLARHKRENWKKKYVTVIRDKHGRFVSWRKWSWHKIRRLLT